MHVKYGYKLVNKDKTFVLDRVERKECCQKITNFCYPPGFG